MLIPICSYFLQYLDSHPNDTKQNLRTRLTASKDRIMLTIMQLSALAIALFFFCLIMKFIFDDAPVNKLDLFIAPMYLFCMSTYGGLAIIIYSSRKKH